MHLSLVNINSYMHVQGSMCARGASMCSHVRMCVEAGVCVGERVCLWWAHMSMCPLSPASSSCSFNSPASIGVPVVGTETWHVCCYLHYSEGTMTDSPMGLVGSQGQWRKGRAVVGVKGGCLGGPLYECRSGRHLEGSQAPRQDQGQVQMEEKGQQGTGAPKMDGGRRYSDRHRRAAHEASAIGRSWGA